MNRTILMVAGLLSASGVLLVDTAVKGTALLVLAAAAAAALRRQSAAARHLVWLLAVVAILVVPVLSALLPQWRALPGWVAPSPGPVAADAGRPSTQAPTTAAAEAPQSVGAAAVEVGRPPGTAFQPPAEPAEPLPASAMPPVVPEPPAAGWGWADALPLVWAVGCCVLTLRLAAARLMLWNSERRATVIGSPGRPADAAHDPLVAALNAARSQLGVRRPVTLLIGPGETIPLVWGVLRCRLLLPASARQWGGEQLLSVLLHELAHVRRHDAAAQLLAQAACAVHWFNPLAWFAAWRLATERERACDDLVLASGVRPSAYAGHLLGVVTGLSPARWARPFGLAMARKSSLEGRLAAVLSQNLNRRRVPAALGAIALVISAGIAVPVAMLRAAADERPDAPARERDEPREPAGAAKLQPGTVEKLEWGEPVNGLRMALAWPPTLGEPAAGEVADLYLAVQNVSDAAVRLCTTAEAPNERGLVFATNGVIQGRIVSSEPDGVDTALAPREVVFLRLFPESAKEPDRPPHGAMTLRADLEVAKAPAGAWTGKLATPHTRAGVGAEAPKNRKALELFKVWLRHARVNGKVPGGCVARLGERVKEFVRANSADKAGEPFAKRMEPLVSRLDGSRDWQPAEASALLADVAAVSDAPLSVMLEELAGGMIQYGLPLNKGLEDAPWGEALPNGLRVACLLEPREAAHRLGTPLKVRILVHNAGDGPVVFRSRTWHHIEPTARDANGAEIGVESVTRFTRPPLVAYRLEPGRFVELASPGVGVGRYGFHDFKDANVAIWIGVKGGEEVTLTPGPVPLGDWNEAPVPDGGPRWWRDFLAARLDLATPLPADAAERAALLEHVVRDYFFGRPTAEETTAFLADRGPNALDSLAERLARRPGVTAFTGSLDSGPTTFRVLPADPNAPRPPEGRPAAEAAE